jgi:hypothetical protein
MNSKKMHEKSGEKVSNKEIKRYCTRVGFPFFLSGGWG